MREAFYRNFKSQLIGLVFIFSLALIGMGFFHYSTEKKAAQEESYDTMRAVSTLKANQLAQWYKERLSEADFFSTNLPYTVYANEIVKGDHRSAPLFRDALLQIMTSKRYENIYMLSREGRLLFSTDPAFDFVDTTIAVYSEKVFQTEKTIIRDLHFCNQHQQIHFEILAPVSDHNGEVIAALVFLVDPEDYLYPLITEWPIPGKTAETYMVRPEGDSVWYLNNLRYLPNSALRRAFSLSKAKITAIQTTREYEGIFEGIDYRGEKVLAGILKIPDSNWFIVSQIDTREIYSDLKRKAVLITVLTLFMILFVSAIMAWLYHFRQRNIYKALSNKSEELRQSQEELGATLYSIGDGVITTDKEGLVKNLNPVAERLTGWTEGEAKGKPIDRIFQIINEESRDKIENPVAKILREGKTVGLENHTLLISKNGTEIPIADSGAPIKNEKGDILGVVMVFSDQSGQRFKQKQIEESEEKYRAMVTQMQLGLAIHEIIPDDSGAPVDYRFIDVNPSYERLTGLKREDIIGKTVLEVLPNTEKIWIEKYSRVVLSGEPVAFESYSLELDKYFSVLAYRNRPNQFAVIVEDISRRKQAEEELRKSEEKYRQITENISDVVWTADLNLKTTYISQSIEHLLGETPEVHLKRAMEEKFPPESLQKIYSVLSEELEKEKKPGCDRKRSRIFELEHYRADKSKIWISMNVSFLRDEKGTPTGLQGITRDITPRKKAEEALRKSEEKMRGIYRVAPTGIGIVSNRILQDVNPWIYEMTGYSKEELIGQDSIILYPSEEEYNFVGKEKYRQIAQKGSGTVETRWKRKNGTIINVLLSSTPVDVSDISKGVIFTVQDITERKQAEILLKEQERRLASLVGNLPGFVYRCKYDSDWTMLYISEGCKMVTGYSPEDLILNNKISFNNVISEEYRDRLFKEWEKVVDKRAPFQMEYEIVTEAGERRWVLERGVGIYDETGKLLFIEGYIEDISERKKAQEDLKLSEERFRFTLQHSPIVIFNQDEDLRYTWIYNPNPGFAAEEVIGKTDRDLLPEEDAARLEEIKLRVLSTGTLTREEVRTTIGGNVFYYDLSVAPVFDEKHNITGITCVSIDVTELKKAEFDLQESERNYRELIDGMNETVWVIDISGDLIDVNKTATKVLEYTKEEILSIGLYGIDSSMEKGMITSLVQNMPKDKIQIFETSHKTKSGRVFPVEIYSSLVHYKGREVILSIARDITERKRMEKKLRDSEETIRLLFNSTAEGIYGIDTDGNCTFCNKAALDMLGYSGEEEIIGQNMHNLIHHTNSNGSVCTAEDCRIYKAFRDGSGTHADDEVLWKKNGTSFPAEYWSYPITRDEKVIGSVVTFVNISKRRHDEEVQQALYEIARTSISAKTTGELLEVVHEELSKVLDVTNFHVALYQPVTGTLNKIFFANEQSGDEEWPAEDILSEKVLKTGKPLLLKGEEVARFMELHYGPSCDVSIKCWLGVPLIDGDKPIGVMVLQSYTHELAYSESSVRVLEMMAYELTIVIQRSKMIEDLIMAKEKAEESDRLKSAFLANVSHEIRTPMNGILGFLELLTEPGIESEEKGRYLDIMNKSGQRLLETINAIVEMAKIESGQVDVRFSEVNVPEVMKDLYDFFRQQTNAKGLELEITGQITGPKAIIRTDKFKLDAILTNLLNNAIKYTREGRIEFGNYAKDGNLVFYIKDTGVGIPSHLIDSIFERFIQTDLYITRPQEGAGLGLSIVKAYIEMLGGNIWVESELERGSTFFFSIPYSYVQE
ncbi:MAG: PAS domain S-box protein [Prolixibacteraceae bacterium]|jgi:PAS domain S-box-containing protein|nr:PAS domain S-box protein [Prolixibacteraceae bacterium]